MFSHKNGQLLIVVVTVLVIISTFIYKVYSDVMGTYADVQTVTEQEYRKSTLLTTMYNAIHERSFILLQMYTETDSFELDDLNQDLGSQARIFITARDKLRGQPLSHEESTLLDALYRLAADSAPYQNQTAELLLEGSHDAAHDLLINKAIPGQHNVLKYTKQVILKYESINNETIAKIKTNMESSSSNIMLLGIILLIASILTLFVIATRFSKKEEKELQQMLLKQKNTSLALSNSEEKLTDYINALSTFTALLTPEGIIEQVNKTSVEVTGLTMGDFVGKKFQNCYWWNYDKKVQEKICKDISQCAFGTIVDREVLVQVKGGHFITIRFFLTPVRDSDGNISYLVAEGQDITERKKVAEKLSYQASHDALTGLINRREFEHRLEHLIIHSNHKHKHALLYLDLDQFKIVNDTCGHHAGDELLRQVTHLIEENSRKSDLFARLGGDEFAIILTACELDQATKVAESVLKLVSTYQFCWESQIFKVGVSIGVVEINGDESNLHEILMHADNACYEAKEAGRNRVSVYQKCSKTLLDRSEQMDWVSRIHKAVQNDSLVLYAQPIVPTVENSKARVSYELLLRMVENGNVIPPTAFLPAAERYDLMVDIDHWVVTKALSILKQNPAFIAAIDHCSINLSGLSLANDEFMTFLMGEIQISGLANKICLEITETAAISNLAHATHYISALHNMGVRFSLDDFGSGLSSFGYLKTLKIDYLKIDGYFVKDIVTDPIDYAMVKSIHEVGSVMGKKTIAEYVENDEILAILREIGVDYAQGYGIAKPAPFEQILNEYRHIKNKKLTG